MFLHFIGCSSVKKTSSPFHVLHILLTDKLGKEPCIYSQSIASINKHNFTFFQMFVFSGENISLMMFLPAEYGQPLVVSQPQQNNRHANRQGKVETNRGRRKREGLSGILISKKTIYSNQLTVIMPYYCCKTIKVTHHNY